MTLRERTVAIAVIGVTGSGKSTFINLASGSNSPVSVSPVNCTTGLTSSTFSLDGWDVMLIDTPGFDDTTPGVLQVLKSISDHFSGLQGTKLSGVIYMHCITEDHMRGPSGHNFHIFSKFCGDTSLRDVVIVTNRRPEVAGQNELFGAAIDKGARMLYHDGSQASTHTILRHLLHRKRADPCPQEGPPVQKTAFNRTTTRVDDARGLSDQVSQRAKAFEEPCQRVGTASITEDEKDREVLQANSLKKIERIRYDLEQVVTNITRENSRLEDENRRYENDFTAQKAEAELRIRLLGEERRARELAEARLAEERALWNRQRTERESLREYAGPKYDKIFACGALIFILLCVSRYAFDGPSPLL